MTPQIILCIILAAVGIVMVSAEACNAWHYSSECGGPYGGSYNRHFRHQHRTYGRYQFRGGYGCHHYEYDRMRAQYGFINL